MFYKMDTNSALLKSSKSKHFARVKKYRAKQRVYKPFNFVPALFEVPLKAALFHFFGNVYVDLFISSGAF